MVRIYYGTALLGGYCSTAMWRSPPKYGLKSAVESISDFPFVDKFWLEPRSEKAHGRYAFEHSAVRNRVLEVHHDQAVSYCQIGWLAFQCLASGSYYLMQPYSPAP